MPQREPNRTVVSARRPAGGPASLLVVIAVLLGLGVAAGCAPLDGSGTSTAGTSGTPGTTTDGAAVVARLVDGDTIHVTLEGEDETVRLIGIDTPESKKPGTPVECFAHEAAAHLAELLPPGTPVRLVRDKDARDRYGRLLAYVYRADDGRFVNQVMVADGYAATLVIKPNTAHAAELADAERAAQAAGLGLWSACGGNHVAS